MNGHKDLFQQLLEEENSEKEITIKIKPWNFEDIFWTVFKFQISTFLSAILLAITVAMIGFLISLFGFALPAFLSKFA